MEKDLLDIVKDKEYFELSSSELDQLTDVCSSEEEFLQMKHVCAKMDALTKESFETKPATKASLDALFSSTYPKASPIWYSGLLTKVAPKNKPIYRQPLMQLAAVALLLLLVVPMFNSGIVGPNNKIAQADIAKEDESKVEVIGDKVEADIFKENKPAQSDFEAQSDNLLKKQETIFVAELNDEVDFIESEMTVFSDVEEVVSMHPDGVFIGAPELEVETSMSAVESSDLLDLLTATF